MQLLKESEINVIDKISKQKKETDLLLSLIQKVWPVLSRSSPQFDQQTRDSLNKLASVMGQQSLQDYDQMQ